MIKLFSNLIKIIYRSSSGDGSSAKTGNIHTQSSKPSSAIQAAMEATLASIELPPPNSGIKQPAENADTAER